MSFDVSSSSTCPRMADHPLVRFADGPAGRRARLAGTGMDLWEVIATVRDNRNDLAASAAYLRVPVGLVDAAVAYYGAHRNELDQLIADNHRVTHEAHAAWRAKMAPTER